MKKYAALLVAVVMCTLGTGFRAAFAPVVPTNSFFVNDYGEVLLPQDRDSILQLARDLERQTGNRLVVLTVNDLTGLDSDSYYQQIVAGWDLGENDGLIFVFSSKKQCTIWLGSNLQAALPPDTQQQIIPTFSNPKNLSAAVHSGYRAIAAELYAAAGLEQQAEVLRPPALAQQAPHPTSNTGTAVLLAVVAIAVGRSMRNSRKYGKKYGTRNSYIRRRSFSTRDTPKPTDPNSLGSLGTIRPEERE